MSSLIDVVYCASMPASRMIVVQRATSAWICAFNASGVPPIGS